MQLLSVIKRWLNRRDDQLGQALVEYSLILSLIAITAIVGLVALNGGVGSLYGKVQAAGDCMASVLGGGSC